MGLRNVITKHHSTFFFNGEQKTEQFTTTRSDIGDNINTTEEYIRHVEELPDDFELFEDVNWLSSLFDIEEIKKRVDVVLGVGSFPPENHSRKVYKISKNKLSLFERNQLF